jgi:serine/threonine-protein kinase RsbW
MTADNRPWTLTIPSDPRLLGIVRQFIEALCEVGNLDQRTTDAVVLALHEAVSNVIRHAHQNDPSAPMQIRCHLSPGLLEIYVLDEGEPFDLAAVPDLDPSELRIGGRGVFLMRSLMDELSCQPRGPRGNTLRMAKRCDCRPRLREGA